MGTGIKDRYNIAINSQGYMLRGAPDKPAYQRSVVASQIDRLAISDLAYADFSGSGLFYIAQTDWVEGIKSEKLWRDDGKYWYSTNIDTFSEQGTMMLPRELTLVHTFDEEVYCGSVAEVDGASNLYIGTYQGSDSRPKVYKLSGSSTWTEILGTDIGTNQNSVSQLFGHKNTLWLLTIGNGATGKVMTYDGTSWTDLATQIDAILTGGQASSAICATELGGTLYVNVENALNDRVHIISTNDNGTTFVEEVYIASGGRILSMKAYAGKIYYLLHFTSDNVSELRVFDPSTSTDLQIVKIYGSVKTFGEGNMNLIEFSNKLIICAGNFVYSYDGSDLVKIYENDSTKILINHEAYADLYYGAVLSKNKLYMANLIYDGESFFNWKKPLGDTTNEFLYPICEDDNQNVYYIDENDIYSIYKDTTNSYKATLANNFLVFNEMSPVVSIDKLLHSVTIMFDALSTSHAIAIYYSINDRSTWVQVGTNLTGTTEGSNVKRELVIPGNIIFNKVWFKIHLSSSNSTTPRIRDFIVAYKPMPDYKNKWMMRVDCSNSLKLLSGQNEERTGLDLMSRLWNEKVTKQKVSFEDLDYIECSLVSAMTATATSARVNSTKRFPRQGRIRAVSAGIAEEMIYTSAETNKILGITRARRGTRAIAYSAGQVIKSDYDVYIDDIITEANFTDENKTESIAQVTLIEA